MVDATIWFLVGQAFGVVTALLWSRINRVHEIEMAYARGVNDVERRACNALASSLVGRLRQVARGDVVEDGLDLIYAEFDALLSRGMFGVCDAALKMLSDDDALPTEHLLALVSITSAANARLAHRASFVRGVRAIIGARDPARVDQLLGPWEVDGRSPKGSG